MLRLSFAGGNGFAEGNGGAQRSTEGFARVVEEVSDGSVKALRFRALDRPFGSIGLTPTERRHCRPLGSGWLRGCGWFGSLGVATCRQTVEGFSRRRPPLGSGWLRGCGWFGSLGVATCRQTVEAFLAPPSTAWQRVATVCLHVTGVYLRWN